MSVWAEPHAPGTAFFPLYSSVASAPRNLQRVMESSEFELWAVFGGPKRRVSGLNLYKRQRIDATTPHTGTGPIDDVTPTQESPLFGDSGFLARREWHIADDELKTVTLRYWGSLESRWS